MIDKNKRQQRRNEEEAAFNSMLICLLGAVIGQGIVLLARRFFLNATASDTGVAIFTFLTGFFQVFMYAGLVLIALGIVWCVLAGKKGKKLFLPGICTAEICLIWIISIVGHYFLVVGFQVLLFVPVVAAVLILIYFLYQRAFFVNAILTGGGIVALWLYRGYYMNHPTVVTACFVGGWVVLVAVVAVLATLARKKKENALTRWVGLDKSVVLSCAITCAVVAAAMLAGFLLGASLAAYALYVLIGWIFCLAVYFTVKLM